MRNMTRLACLACLSVGLAAAPIGFGFQDGSSLVAYAKGGNGGGNGGGGGNGHGGKGAGKSSASTSKSTSGSKRHVGQSKDPIAATLDNLFGKKKKSDTKKAVTRTERKPARKAAVATTETAAVKPEKAKLAGLNSLKRNYHAYMNSSDPRMVALSAYALAYAQFELENGTEVSPTDPALGDEALREALLAAANPNRVEQYGDDYIDEATLTWAKDVLGVGPSVGKIDEIRDSLAAQQAEEIETGETEPVADEPEIVVEVQ